MSIEIIKALNVLRPNSEWSLIDDDYSNIEWLSNDSKPSAKEVIETITKLTKIEQDQAILKAEAKTALLERLGITEDEAKLLLS